MAIRHYDGELGIFDYDDEEFELRPYRSSEILYYGGKETYGSKIHIPEGIRDCRCMFSGCKSLETAPAIPDGVENCCAMFSCCESLKTPSIIPDGVKDCSGMFYGCNALEVPTAIPDSVENCCSMFQGCYDLKEASTILNSVKNCEYMFYGCSSLKIPPVIPDSVENCDSMFSHCKSLETVPVISKIVFIYDDMFFNCSDEIQKAGKWNLDHRGQSYEKEIIDKKLEQYGLSDISKDFDLSMKMNITDLGGKCKDSNSVYIQIINDIKDGFITDLESLKQEIKAMDACIEQMKIDKRNKQVSSEFGDIEQTDNFEQQAKDIGE